MPLLAMARLGCYRFSHISAGSSVGPSRPLGMWPKGTGNYRRCQMQGNRVNNARSAVPAVIVFWNGALVILAEKEFHHEGTKFPMKSPGVALGVRFLRDFVVKQALARTPMHSRPRYQKAIHPIALMSDDRAFSRKRFLPRRQNEDYGVRWVPSIGQVSG